MRVFYAHPTVLIATALIGLPCFLRAESSKPKNPAGSQHGFILLRDSAGTTLASGELIEIPLGDRIKVRVIFHFLDGSLDDETTLYSKKTFGLISDHHIQRGRSFPQPLDCTIDLPGQRVTLRTVSNGKAVVTSEPMELPPDLANGVIYGVIQNLPPDSPKVEVPYLAPTAKPRLVKLAISPETEEAFKVGGRSYKAIKYVVKVNLGGLTGMIAPMIGKQPSDTHVWVLKSSVPTVLRVDGALYNEGPIWSLQLASPAW